MVANRPSSTKTWSACRIQSSHRSATSAAISPSPKLNCARRMLITGLAPALRWFLLRTQKLVVDFANGLDRLLQFLIILQPAAHFGNALAAQAELLCVPTRVAHGEDRQLVPFAARAFRAASCMIADRTLQQRATQDLSSHRQPVEQFLARRKDMFPSHLYR